MGTSLHNLWFAMVPACMGFGPLFMTNIGGSSKTEYLSTLGVFMLVLALMWMWKTITAQSIEIELLKKKLQA